MNTDRLFGNTLAMLERSLNLRSRNQKLIVSNLANLDTPNYKAFKMMVADQMAGHSENDAQVTMTRTRIGHMASGHAASETMRAERIDHNPLSMRGDGNTVELEREMSNLAENTLMYNTATRLVANKFNLLKSVIKGGS
ncbi:MAG: flagellar basal body rod protein FlgB [Desulfobacterales bacterium]|nr:flagellar basal body rod protein FlgB [Desulfobacterales bacterium]